MANTCQYMIIHTYNHIYIYVSTSVNFYDIPVLPHFFILFQSHLLFFHGTKQVPGIFFPRGEHRRDVRPSPKDHLGGLREGHGQDGQEGGNRSWMILDVIFLLRSCSWYCGNLTVNSSWWNLLGGPRPAFFVLWKPRLAKPSRTKRCAEWPRNVRRLWGDWVV